MPNALAPTPIAKNSLLNLGAEVWENVSNTDNSNPTMSVILITQKKLEYKVNNL